MPTGRLVNVSLFDNPKLPHLSSGPSFLRHGFRIPILDRTSMAAIIYLALSSDRWAMKMISTAWIMGFSAEHAGGHADPKVLS